MNLLQKDGIRMDHEKPSGRQDAAENKSRGLNQKTKESKLLD